MNTTEWKPLDVIDCSNYMVSSQGEVLHQTSGRLKEPSLNQYGTYFVNLTDDFGKQRSFPVASLVAYAFLGMSGLQPGHNTLIYKDGNRENYTLDNLAYRTRSYAIRYNKYFASGDRFEANARFPLESEDRDGHIQHFDTLLEAAVYHGVLPEDIVISMHHERPVYIVDGLRFRNRRR